MVAGGAGYIGSHAVKQLIEAGHRVVAVDNLFRGHRQAVDRRGRLPRRSTWPKPRPWPTCSAEHAIDCVMHFAALAYVGESVTDPLGLLRQQHGRHDQPVEGDEDGGREAAGVQFHLRHLRRARGDADRRNHAAVADQSLRLVEMVRRAGVARLRRRRSAISPSSPCAISTWRARRPTARWARTTTRKRT